MRGITTIAMLWIVIGLQAQVDFKLIEQHIINDYKILERALLEADPERQQIFARKVERQIMFALLQEGSYYYPFNRLQQYVQIIESEDKKLRVFSWDAMGGSSWRKMYAIAQFRGVQNESYFRVLSSGQQQVGSYEDVGIDAIYLLNDPKSGRTYYLMIGRGHQEIGQEHATIRLSYLTHSGLVDCKTCLEGGATWTLKGASNFPMNLTYDAKRKQFHYLKPTYNSITGKREEGLYHKMYWIDGRFRNY